MTIKVRTWGGVGDVLLLTPSLRAIKKAYPSCRLKVYCSRADDVEILRHNPHIDVLKPSTWRWPASAYFISQAIAAFVEAPGRYHSLVGHIWRRVRVRMAPYASVLPTLTQRHAIQLIAEMLGVDEGRHPLEVFFTPAEEQRARESMARYSTPIVMHTTSISSVNKNWPIEHWTELVQRNPQYTFVQLGAASDTAVSGAIDFRGKTTLRESFALIKYATAFVGVESGLAHATNAVATPSVVLFGPTAPEVWAHPNSRVISRRARCAPCIDLLLDTPCPYGAFCMTEISVDEVQAALRDQVALREVRADRK